MTRLISIRLLGTGAMVCILGLASGCGGDNGDATADAGDPADAAPGGDGGEGDGGTPVQTVAASGRVLDYFNPMQPISGAQISTDGLIPTLSATALGDGSFALANVPVGSSFYVDASAPELTTFRVTRNEPIEAADQDVMVDVFLIAETDVGRQHSQVPDENGGVILPDPAASFVIVDLRQNNGMPLVGVAAAEIFLDDPNDPVGLGPYFFDGTGNIVPTLPDALSEAHGGRARVGFLNVPAGERTLYVNYTNNQGQPRQFMVPFTSTAAGAMLLRTGGQDDGMMTPNLGFEADIYPVLQTSARGGAGCANCHNPVGQASGTVVFELPAAEVHAILVDPAQPNPDNPYVNLADPPASQLLTNPLYDNPPDHPNATFLTTEDPRYQMILQWIEQGANL